jgi:hypothetical protein
MKLLELLKLHSVLQPPVQREILTLEIAQGNQALLVLVLVLNHLRVAVSALEIPLEIIIGKIPTQACGGRGITETGKRPDVVVLRRPGMMPKERHQAKPPECEARRDDDPFPKHEALPPI